MSKPVPEPIASGQLFDLATAVIKADRSPLLATIEDNRPGVRRPFSPVRTDGFTVYVASLREYPKTREIAVNPRVVLWYLNDHHDVVRISGVVEVVNDRELLQKIWEANPLLRNNYLGSIDDPTPIVYRIRPEQVQYIKVGVFEFHKVPLERPD